MAWSLSFYIFINYLILFRPKYCPFLLFLVPYYSHSERETKLGLKALKDLDNINNKYESLKDLKDKNSK